MARYNRDETGEVLLVEIAELVRKVVKFAGAKRPPHRLEKWLAQAGQRQQQAVGNEQNSSDRGVFEEVSQPHDRFAREQDMRELAVAFESRSTPPNKRPNRPPPIQSNSFANLLLTAALITPYAF
jgi:hypothetical protein